jgi:hypothetical protein
MTIESINGLWFVTDGVDCVWVSDKDAVSLQRMNSAQQIGQLHRMPSLSRSERALVQQWSSELTE